jgi:hypothetical protein
MNSTIKELGKKRERHSDYPLFWSYANEEPALLERARGRIQSGGT